MSEFIDRIVDDTFDYILSSLIWFSKNPLGAMKISTDRVVMQFSSLQRRKEIENRIEKEMMIYPGNIIRRWPIGIWVLLSFILIFFYALIYMIFI